MQTRWDLLTGLWRIIMAKSKRSIIVEYPLQHKLKICFFYAVQLLELFFAFAVKLLPLEWKASCYSVSLLKRLSYRAGGCQDSNLG